MSALEQHCFAWFNCMGSSTVIFVAIISSRSRSYKIKTLAALMWGSSPIVVGSLLLTIRSDCFYAKHMWVSVVWTIFSNAFLLHYCIDNYCKNSFCKTHKPMLYFKPAELTFTVHYGYVRGTFFLRFLKLKGGVIFTTIVKAWFEVLLWCASWKRILGLPNWETFVRSKLR